MKKIGLLLVLAFTVSTVFAQKKVKLDKAIAYDEDATGVFIFGDWGRGGEYKQKELANAMGAAAKKFEPEFIISTGDNFYPNGIASISDPQWITSFENVYSDHSLNINWFVVLGNHDYRGNMQAEIDYTKISKRWNMPAAYYSFEQELEDGSKALFVFVDTNPLNDEYYGEEKYASKVATQDTTKQIIWLKKTLEESNADWKIVTGHHPLYTGGKRIEDPNDVRNHLLPILKEYEVDFYLAGHEHDLQYIKPSGKTHHIVSGAGSEVRPTGYLETTVFAESRQGFGYLSLKKGAAHLSFIDYKGKLLYETNIVK
ncbi:tartrate-resistant acid phosphatase type 5 family protein [uncultured Arcticibacterium sp.]|uniref:purple acid phosphatase family protein n=1 Tax=uncultured Arcticibacterium sp. TaxID=2173042 RepID=UPI0030FB6D5B